MAKKIDLSDEAVRTQKLDNIKQAGVQAYPDSFDQKETLAEALTKKENQKIQVAGRLLSWRDMGKLSFGHLQDATGKMQIVLKEDVLKKDSYTFFLKHIDIGDILGIEGEIYTTQKGEKSILVKKYTLLAKALLPLPEKWHGLQDTETKYRQRYLDLISNRETFERFQFRSKLIQLLRKFYWQEGFMEIETPILASTASGALAKPFKTHHEALDIDLFLRIAPETYLKEAVVGGFERVFEIGRVFRNEGIDPSHLQDFTMVEHYAAYWNYQDNMKFTEKMLTYLLKELLGTLKVDIMNRDGKKVTVNFKAPWPVVTFRELIKKDCGIDIDDCDTVEKLRKEIKGKKIKIDDSDALGRGNLIDALYKEVSRPKLTGPVFLTKHPLDLSPLARKNDDNPNVVDRFQLVVVGWEIINAYSELVDPIDQEERFAAQASAKEAGDTDAHGKDDEYVKAMKYGMPPMSGWGMGIDRLVTLLTSQDNLKDVVMFPLMRPKNLLIHKSSGEMKNISRDEAWKLLKDHMKDPANLNHSRESEVIMRALAKHLGENEELWGNLGLLHDIDWEYGENTHCKKCVEILAAAKLDGEFTSTIVSHAYGIEMLGPEFVNSQRTTKLQHLLAAAETLTGLIYASALVRPDKKLASVELQSIKKKMKDKSFAANVDRNIIRECETAGIPLDDFLAIGLKAMQEISGELGL